jgi:hypothetical protein
MNRLLADLILATPWLAVALPIVFSSVGVLLLWRARARLGPGWWHRPLAVVPAVTVAGGISATVVLGLGAGFAPSPPSMGEIAALGFGTGAVVALGCLAGYAAFRLRNPPLAGLGFILGPLVLSGLPLEGAPLLRDATQPIIAAAYQDAALERGAVLGVTIDRLAPIVVDGRVEAVDLRLTITSARWLDLVPSDTDIDWGLVYFSLVPPEGPDALLAARSPSGEPRYLGGGPPITYELTFDGPSGVVRSTGDWSLTIEFIGNGEAYAWQTTVRIDGMRCAGPRA